MIFDWLFESVFAQMKSGWQNLPTEKKLFALLLPALQDTGYQRIKLFSPDY